MDDVEEEEEVLDYDEEEESMDDADEEEVENALAFPKPKV